MGGLRLHVALREPAEGVPLRRMFDQLPVQPGKRPM
jgi:hypothetical protein